MIQPLSTQYSHQTFMNLPKNVLQNRLLLKTLMEKNGFKVFETKWWHYYLTYGNSFELPDIDFNKLKNEL